MLWNDNKSPLNLDLKITNYLVLKSEQGEEYFLEGILWLIYIIYLWGTWSTVVGRRVPQKSN